MQDPCSVRRASKRCLLFVCTSAMVPAFAGDIRHVTADTLATWDGSSADWSDATRWSSNPVVPNNTADRTFDVVIQSGFVNVDIPVVIDEFTFTGDGLNGTLDITVENRMTLGGGRIGGNGVIRAQGGLLLTGSSTEMHASIESSGLAVWESGLVRTRGSSNPIFRNLPSGVLDVRPEETIESQSAFHVPIVNEGLLRRSTGMFATTLLEVQNDGTVAVESGAIGISRFSGVGSYEIAEGTLLELGRRGPTVQTLESAARITGSGDLDFAGSEIAMEGTIDVTGNVRVLQSGMRLRPGSNLVQSWNQFEVRSSLFLETASPLIFTAPVRISGDVTSNGIHGDDDVTFLADLEWLGSGLHTTGRLELAGNTRMSGPALNVDGTTLENTGIIVWESDTLRVENDASILNHPGGVFDIRHNARINFGSYPAPTFENRGILLRSAGTGDFTFNAHLVNRGLFEIQTGIVTINLALGSFVQTAGATHLDGGNLRSAFDGLLEFEGGELTGGGTIDGNVDSSAAIVGDDDVANTLTITGHYAQHDLARLVTEILEPSEGSFDRVLAGEADVAGTIEIQMLQGARVSDGDSFLILIADQVTVAPNLELLVPADAIEGRLDLVTVVDGPFTGKDAIRFTITNVIPSPSTVAMVATLVGPMIMRRSSGRRTRRPDPLETT
ncbi:MAG: hypothetical protein CMJ18_04555 [Phycisphaeraceae bacterium]|nr:hypothetical protein [Phycisphaeraceae bacterium]